MITTNNIPISIIIPCFKKLTQLRSFEKVKKSAIVNKNNNN